MTTNEADKFNLGTIAPADLSPGMFAVVTDGEEVEHPYLMGSIKGRYAAHLAGEVVRVRAASGRFLVLDVLTGAYTGQSFTLDSTMVTLAYPDPIYKETKLGMQAAQERKARCAAARWWQFWKRTS